jgi:hypothetical protein
MRVVLTMPALQPSPWLERLRTKRKREGFEHEAMSDTLSLSLSLY